jgi:hypothetical protein
MKNCRTLPQYTSMSDGYENKKCPFDDPLDPTKNKVIAERSTWRMWQNPFPAKGALLHLIMATKEHVLANPIALRKSDFLFMGALWEFAQEEFRNILGPLNDGWEAHIIVPDRTGSVRVKLGDLEQLQSSQELGHLIARDWRDCRNPRPLPHTTKHIVLVRTTPSDTLVQADFYDTGALFCSMYHLMPGGGFIIVNKSRTAAFAMRFGSIKYNEGSVLHQHANILVCDPTNPIDIPLAKDPDEVQKGLRRMVGFELLRTGTLFEDLPEDLKELVKDRLK